MQERYEQTPKRSPALARQAFSPGSVRGVGQAKAVSRPAVGRQDLPHALHMGTASYGVRAAEGA